MTIYTNHRETQVPAGGSISVFLTPPNLLRITKRFRMIIPKIEDRIWIHALLFLNGAGRRRSVHARDLCSNDADPQRHLGHERMGVVLAMQYPVPRDDQQRGHRLRKNDR